MEKTDRDKFKLLLKMGILLTIMISYGVYSNFDNLKWYFVSTKTFKQTTGQIISSEIEGGGVHGGWRFHITYNYYIGDQSFVSERVHFGYQALADPSYAKSYIKKYPVGMRVVVYYDDDNPRNSVLEPQVKWDGLLDFYVLILLLPIIIFGLSAHFFIRSRQ